MKKEEPKCRIVIVKCKGRLDELIEKFNQLEKEGKL